MYFKIITDSCCDLPNIILDKIETIPMTLMLDGKSYKDGINITREKFYDLMKRTKKLPGSSAPSPYEYLSKYNFDDNKSI